MCGWEQFHGIGWGWGGKFISVSAFSRYYTRHERALLYHTRRHFNLSWFYRADKQTDRKTESDTDVAKRYAPATVVGVSKYA